MTKLTKLKPVLNSPTLKLSFTYWLLIMVLSISFSIVFYHTSYRQLGRQAPPNEFFNNTTFNNPNQLGQNNADRREFDIFIKQRIEEGRAELLTRLIILNSLASLIGALLGYALARNNLRPIEANIESQNRFVSDASHELRTPLTALQATNEVALRKPKLTEPVARQLLQENIHEVIKLKELSEGLLNLLKQDSKPAKLRPTNLQDVSSEAINTVIALAQAKNIVIEDLFPPQKVLANQASLTRLLIILLENAIKYSQPKSHVKLKSETKNKHLFILVEDNGIGIKATEIPHLFERFYRADTSRSKLNNQGYGLGLAIAQNIGFHDIKIQHAINQKEVP
jgi:signal transduction histidine kinase